VQIQVRNQSETSGHREIRWQNRAVILKRRKKKRRPGTEFD
jgi:hypothetical protein